MLSSAPIPIPAVESDIKAFLDRSRHLERSGVFRICNGDGIGYIHLRNGRIIHASSRELSGDAALVRMLAWVSESSVDACDCPLSPVSTIDNEFAFWPSNSVPTPTTKAANMPEEKPENFIALAGGEGATSLGKAPLPLADFQPESHDPERHSWNLLARDCDAAVGMSAEGEVLFAHGNADDLADIAALATRLAQLTAESLGMEEVMAMECTGKNETYLIYRATGGEQIALKPKPGVPLHTIKAALDL